MESHKWRSSLIILLTLADTLRKYFNWALIKTGLVVINAVQISSTSLFINKKFTILYVIEQAQLKLVDTQNM
jgi:hypothetical protein